MEDGIGCTPSFISHCLCSCMGSCTHTWHIPSHDERLQMLSPPTDFQKMIENNFGRREKLLQIFWDIERCKCYQVLEYFNIISCKHFWYLSFYQTEDVFFLFKWKEVKMQNYRYHYATTAINKYLFAAKAYKYFDDRIQNFDWKYFNTNRSNLHDNIYADETKKRICCYSTIGFQGNLYFQIHL